jgi:hypothetical protein
VNTILDTKENKKTRYRARFLARRKITKNMEEKTKKYEFLYKEKHQKARFCMKTRKIPKKQENTKNQESLKKYSFVHGEKYRKAK